MILNKNIFTNENFTRELVEAVDNRLENKQYEDAVKQALLYLTDVVREKTGLTEDGYSLMSKTFKKDNPAIKINNLITDTDKNDQQGVMLIGQGIYSAFRNPLNHSIHTRLTEKECIRQLIIIDMMLDYANKEIRENNTIANVLFESVNMENKEFYLERGIDIDISERLKLKNVWIYGEPGIGKTNIAQYYFLNNRSFYHSIYFTSTENDIDSYLNLIFEDLLDELESEEIKINNNFGINRKLSNILCHLSKSNTSVTIHLDELSDLGDEMFQTFFISLIDILTNIRDNCNLDNVNFIITTLFNPTQYVDNIENESHKNKINSQFDFIALEKWSNDEMTQLIDFIVETLGITTTTNTQLELLKGNPRELKRKIKDEITNT